MYIFLKPETVQNFSISNSELISLYLIDISSIMLTNFMIRKTEDNHNKEKHKHLHYSKSRPPEKKD